MSDDYIPRVAILASGSGSTAEAFIRAAVDGRVAAEVALIVCNHPPDKAGIYQRIARLNKSYGLDIEVIHISSQTHPDGKLGRGQTRAESAAICQLLLDENIDHVALMGYMKVVSGDLIETFGWKPDYASPYMARMSNTHPGPLPETADTYGVHASARVLELGLPESRHTFHLVADGVDTGPVLAEHPVAVEPDDTPESLFDRVQIVEKIALPYAIDRFLAKQIEFREKL